MAPVFQVEVDPPEGSVGGLDTFLDDARDVWCDDLGSGIGLLVADVPGELFDRTCDVVAD
jgi:hypothetical protein